MSYGFGSTYGASASDLVTSSFKLSGSNQRSYSFWYWANSSGGASLGRVFQKGSGANFQEGVSALSDATPSGALGFIRSNAAGTVVTAQHGWGPATNDNLWHHVLLTHDNTSGTSVAPSVWLDGVPTVANPVGQGDGAQAFDNTTPFTVGNRSDLSRNWDGMLGHIAIWDNILLGGGEAAALAAGASPLQLRPEFLQWYMPLDPANPELEFVLGDPSFATISGGKAGRAEPAASRPFAAPGLAIDHAILAAAGVTIALAQAAWGWLGNAVGVNAKMMPPLASGRVSWSGNPVGIAGNTIITLSRAAWSFLASALPGFTTLVASIGLVRGAVRGLVSNLVRGAAERESQ
jgi:hypothetical protein